MYTSPSFGCNYVVTNNNLNQLNELRYIRNYHLQDESKIKFRDLQQQVMRTKLETFAVHSAYTVQLGLTCSAHTCSFPRVVCSTQEEPSASKVGFSVPLISELSSKLQLTNFLGYNVISQSIYEHPFQQHSFFSDSRFYRQPETKVVFHYSLRGRLFAKISYTVISEVIWRAMAELYLRLIASRCRFLKSDRASVVSNSQQVATVLNILFSMELFVKYAYYSFQI